MLKGKPKRSTKSNPENEELKYDPQNFRLHPDLSKSFIRKSLDEVGAGRSILVDGDNIVRAGNGVLEVAKAKGLKVQIVDSDANTLIAVRRKDLKGRKAIRAALLDNRAQEYSAWDTGALSTIQRNDAELLKGIFESEKQLANALSDGSETQKEAPPRAETPEKVLERLQAKWRVKAGLLFEIPSLSVPDKSHYIMCGDCREIDVKAIGGDVNGVVTSPPYAEQRVKQYGGIKVEKYVEWFNGVQASIRKCMVDGSSFFLNIKPHAENGQRSLYVHDLVAAMVRQWGWKFTEEYCWRKNHMPGLDKFRFRNAWEPVYQFTLSERPFIYHHQVAKVGKSAVFQDTTIDEKFDGSGIFDNTIAVQGEVLPDNVIEAYGAHGIHPATFPIGLAEFFIKAFSKPGERWLDPFCGSGTVLQAAERSGRVAVGLELKPEFCALQLENLSELGLTPGLARLGSKR